MVPRTDIRLGQWTNVGQERKENQDYYGYYEPLDDAEFKTKGRLLVVCDGMGGAAGGQIASQLGVKTALKVYKEDSTGNIPDALRTAIESANKAIWNEAQARPELYGMGSTSVALAIKDGTGYFAHTGDSRIYRIRGGELTQMTKDHSLVQQMVDEGIIEPSEMETHPRKNVILRSLGVKPEIEVELQFHSLQVGDVYILSSDGLTGPVNKDDCKAVYLANKKDPQKAAEALVAKANEHGGPDNISVQVVEIMSLQPGKLLAKGARAAKELPTTEEMADRVIDAKADAARKAAAAKAAEEKGEPAAPAEKKGVTMAMAAPDKDALEKAKKEAAEAGKRRRAELLEYQKRIAWKPKKKTIWNKLGIDPRIPVIVGVSLAIAVGVFLMLKKMKGS